MPEITLRPSQISANGSSNGQILMSNGSITYWASGGTGYNGSVGFTGSSGTSGYNGSTGFTGSIGFTGSAGAGYTGSSAALSVSDYVVQGRLNADQSIPSLADTTIQFIDDFDPQNWWNASTYRFTPTIAGYYEIKIGVWWTASTANTGQNNIQARKNNNTFMILQWERTSVNGRSVTGSKLVYLNGSSDYVDFTAYTDVSQSIQYGSSNGQGTWFSAALITNGVGYTGSIGSTGYVGSAGSLGYTGSTGSQGTAGFTGSVGFTGSLGFTGSTGFTGSSGFAGSVGFTGSLGFVGSLGFTGSTGIGFTGSVGFVGSTGTGFTGSAGAAGTTGFTGSAGSGGGGSAASANASSQTFTGNGSNTLFTLQTSVNNSNNILVTLDGLLQIPTIHYTVSGANLNFTSSPINSTVIEIRNLESGVIGTATSTDVISPFLLMGA